MALSLSKNLAPCMLILTSAHGLSRLSRHFYYARAAFKLYIVCGCVLLAQSLAQDQDLSLAIQTCWIWSHTLGLPLLSADICFIPQLLPDLAPFHIAIPVYSLIIQELAPCPGDSLLLIISHTLSIFAVAIAYVSNEAIARLGYIGTALAVSIRLSPYNHTELSYFENWCFVMSLANFYAYQLLRRYRWSSE
ncbi:hypothetical protein O3M35_002922 [Rhynocoris fuscipes]|uniref:Uncharacterized protein n=1 Tax=Rhynocoris fuscipes TaxID=488301 RepID=A0AAW1CR46_9HEMI